MIPALRFLLTTFLLAASIWGAPPNPARAEPILVFAAASLQDVMTDVITGFEAESGHNVVASFAGSSAVARQLEYGAPADVIMLANVNWMEHLKSKGLLNQEAGKRIFGNALALVVPAKSEVSHAVTDVSDLYKILNTGRIAMALVEAVPAGIYGKEALTSLGLWQAVEATVVETDNVRAALSLVALGEVASGIVYVTDALADDRVEIVAQFPHDSHEEIVYPAAVVAGRDRPEVLEFMTYLDGEVARRAFVERGFTLLEDAR
jgi:molybdate transport system substrate-binding protein